MKIKSSLLVSLITLCALFSPVKSDLKDISKPHLGYYSCEKATLSGVDLKEKFSSIKLELKKDNTFTLTFEKKRGGRGEEQGRYEYNAEKESIRILSDKGLDKEFPLKKGVIYAQFKVGLSNLVMQFKQD